MQAGKTGPIGQELGVTYRKERSFECGEQRKFIIRALDRRKRVANRLDFFARVKRATPHQQVWKTPRLDRANIRPGDISPKVAKATEKETHVARLYRFSIFRAFALGNRPSTFLHEPVNERGNSIWQRFVNSPLNDLAVIAVRPGNR